MAKPLFIAGLTAGLSQVARWVEASPTAQVMGPVSAASDPVALGEEVVAAIQARPGVAIVAEGWGALLAAHLAVERLDLPIGSALLVGPLPRGVAPPAWQGLLTPSRAPLPFPTAVMAGPAARPEDAARLRRLAADWGATYLGPSLGWPMSLGRLGPAELAARTARGRVVPMPASRPAPSLARRH